MHRSFATACATRLRIRTLAPLVGVALATAAAMHAPQALAADVNKGIEQALATAQQEKKGVTLHVSGQAIGGGVVRIEPGQYVEMKSQQYGRMVVRLDRIDAVLMP